jgi:hypothetical protein
MRLDIYRRAEQDGKFSYLAVPETRNIPEEATNTDWEVEARAFEVDDDAQQIEDYDIQNLNSQLAEKATPSRRRCIEHRRGSDPFAAAVRPAYGHLIWYPCAPFSSVVEA